MESMDNAEDMKEHNQSNEEAGGKVEIEFWKIIVIFCLFIHLIMLWEWLESLFWIKALVFMHACKRSNNTISLERFNML